MNTPFCSWRVFLSMYKNLHWLSTIFNRKNVFWTWEEMDHNAVYQNTSFNSTPRICTSLQDQWKGGEILRADPVHKSSWSFQWDWFHPQEKKTNENKPKRTEAVIQEVKSFFEETLSCSLRKASQQISPTKTTLWRIVRHDHRFRFYHYTLV